MKNAILKKFPHAKFEEKTGPENRLRKIAIEFFIDETFIRLRVRNK